MEAKVWNRLEIWNQRKSSRGLSTPGLRRHPSPSWSKELKKMCRSKCKSNKYRNLGTLRTFLCLMLSDGMCISIHISYLSCRLLWLISSTQTHHFVIFLCISCLLEQSLKQDLRASFWVSVGQLKVARLCNTECQHPVDVPGWVLAFLYGMLNINLFLFISKMQNQSKWPSSSSSQATLPKPRVLQPWTYDKRAVAGCKTIYRMYM